MEAGSFRGGGALHFSNSAPNRKIIICDSFGGFEKLHPVLDKNFHDQMFKNTTHEGVDRLYRDRGRDYKIPAGFFPAICKEQNFNPAPLSFVHMDVDAYKPTIESLEYLEPLMLERSLFVFDDFLRRAAGVMQAVTEFAKKRPSWVAFPMFPAQGLMVHQSWFAGHGNSNS